MAANALNRFTLRADSFVRAMMTGLFEAEFWTVENFGMLAGLSDGSCRQACERRSVRGGSLALLRASPWSHV